ncbi:MAG: hypothetical protein Q4C96_02395 [Planctomycetia bacterium]|nr:hypothetical protein [Planctomycetia bacterium]
MMNTYLRVLSTLTILISFYFVDMLFLAPLVTPPAIIIPPDTSQRRLEKNLDLLPFFPAGSWEISHSNYRVNFGEGIFIFNDYEIEERKIIHVNTCTFIFFPDRKNASPSSENPEREFAIIVRVPEGAELHLDSPINIMEGKLGTPVWGRLRGKVEIYSFGKTHAPDDDLRIETRDIIYENLQIRSTHIVEFRFGAHSGRGSDFIITLDTSLDNNSMQLSGIKSFELKHLSQLNIQVPITENMLSGISDNPSKTSDSLETPTNIQQLLFHSADLTGMHTVENRMPHISPLQDPASADYVSSPPALSTSWYLPVKLTCDGPIFYDVYLGEASFSQNVYVEWFYKTHLSDYLHCEKLQFNLLPETQETASEITSETDSKIAPEITPENFPASENLASEPTQDSINSFSKLQPHQIIASGAEVILHSRQFSVVAKGNQLNMNIPQKVLMLESSQEATLQRNNQEFHARSIRFTQTKTGMGEVNVMGSGWMQYLMQENGITQDIIRASWRTEFRMYPEIAEEYAITLDGNTTVESQKIGKLSAEKLFLWLRKKTPEEIAWEQNQKSLMLSSPAASDSQKEKDSLPYRLARIRALNNVTLWANLDKTGIHGRFAQMDLWFLSIPEAGNTLPTAEILHAVQQNSSRFSSKTHSPTDTPDTLSHTSETPKTPPNIFNIQAETLQGNIILQDSLVFVSKVLIQTGVQIQERSEEPLPSEIPLYVQGDKITLTDLLPTTLQAEIVGSPAILKGRGAELSGNAIFMNCRSNNAWIPGTGKMTLFLRKDLDGKMLATPQHITITWEDGMNFDGQMTTFSRQVHIRHPQHTMKAQQLQTFLSEKIIFSNMTTNNAFQFTQFSASGKVLTQNQILQEGKYLANIRLGADKIDYHPVTGDFTITPGNAWLQATFDATDFLQKQEENAPPDPEVQDPHSPPRLYHVSMTFLGGAQGNALRKEIVFRDRINAVADEVGDWGTTISLATDPIRLGKYGFLLKSNILTINQSPEVMEWQNISENILSQKQPMAVEFEAEEDVRVEMTTFSAKASRMSYSYLKDLMILTGARNRVQISFQEIPGAPRRSMEAQKIEFRPSTRAINIDDMKAQGIF